MKYTDEITREQWQWLLERYAEGYPLTEIADWVGLHPRTVSRRWDALGLRLHIKELLPPLRERRGEFDRLGWRA